MLKLKQLKQFTALMLFVFSSGVHAEVPVDPYASTVEKTIKPIMHQYKIPGMAVELIINGEAHEYYYGVASRETNEEVTRKTIFELGSISKLMTSILVAQEIDWAKMSLSDPINKYLKELPKALGDITIQNLATHTSGLPMNLPSDINNKEDVIPYLASLKPGYDPSDEWIYSNVGMGLLGYALEASTEKSYDQLYYRHLMLPLKMVNGVDVPSGLKKYYAQGYNQHDKPVNQITYAIFPAAYGVKASASDMQKFLGAAIGLPGTPARVLYPIRLTQSVFLKVGRDFQGLGWQIHPIINNNVSSLKVVSDKVNLGPREVDEIYQRPTYDGDALIDKTGATNGFRSYIGVLPNKQSGIVILANKDVPNRAIVSPARELLFGLVKNKS